LAAKRTKGATFACNIAVGFVAVSGMLVLDQF